MSSGDGAEALQPVDRGTDTTENITFQQLHWRAITSIKCTIPRNQTQLGMMRKLIFHSKQDCKYDLFAGDKRPNKDLLQIAILTVEHTPEINEMKTH